MREYDHTKVKRKTVDPRETAKVVKEFNLDDCIEIQLKDYIYFNHFLKSVRRVFKTVYCLPNILISKVNAKNEMRVSYPYLRDEEMQIDAVGNDEMFKKLNQIVAKTCPNFHAWVTTGRDGNSCGE